MPIFDAPIHLWIPSINTINVLLQKCNFIINENIYENEIGILLEYYKNYKKDDTIKKISKKQKKYFNKLAIISYNLGISDIMALILEKK
jgi:hypothetical protein